MYCLKKSLYGLKQASRQLHIKLLDELKSLAYTQSQNDYSLFIKSYNTKITIVAMYVDDIIITGDDVDKISSLKKHLNQVFTIKDLGELHYFLGIEVSH